MLASKHRGKRSLLRNKSSRSPWIFESLVDPKASMEAGNYYSRRLVGEAGVG